MYVSRVFVGVRRSRCHVCTADFSLSVSEQHSREESCVHNYISVHIAVICMFVNKMDIACIGKKWMHQRDGTQRRIR